LDAVFRGEHTVLRILVQRLHEGIGIPLDLERWTLSMVSCFSATSLEVYMYYGGTERRKGVCSLV
jgi:hypothetical protein